MENLTRIYQSVLPEKLRDIIRGRKKNPAAQAHRINQLQTAFDLYKSKGLIFIHIPKAAGVSVFHAIYGEDSWGHEPLSAFVDLFGKDEVYSVPRACMVRNPYYRLYSGYKYLRGGGRGKGHDLLRQEMLLPYDTFEKFVKDYLSSGKALEIIHFKPQHYWVTDANGELGVDYVGRFETIEESFDEMIGSFDIKAAPLPKFNKNSNYVDKDLEAGKVLKEFDSEMISIVNDFYKDDFRLFGYSCLD